MKASRIYFTGGLLAAAVAGALYGFVPSCEKELAQYYPLALRGDLSACGAKTVSFKPTAAADPARFARLLNGSWELKMRTTQGLVADTRLTSARLYFDVAADS